MKYCSDNTDIAGIHHAVNFAATWTNSGFNKKPYIFTKAIFPSSSFVLTKGELDGAGGGTVFVFTSKFSFNKKDNEVYRAEKLLDAVSSTFKRLLKSYKRIFVRVSIQYLEIDKLKDFLELGLGFLLDVDPISGWIWITNDEDTYVHEDAIGTSTLKKTVYTGGLVIRKCLCECLVARHMVDQTHASYGGGYKKIAVWPNVKFKQDFDNAEEAATLVTSNELDKLDGIVVKPGAARADSKNPFEAAKGVGAGGFQPLSGSQAPFQAQLQPKAQAGPASFQPKASPSPFSNAVLGKTSDTTSLSLQNDHDDPFNFGGLSIQTSTK